MSLIDNLGFKNGGISGWIRTVLLGIAIGGAWYNLKYDIQSLRDQAVNDIGRRLGIAEIELGSIREKQGSRLPIFDRMVVQVDDHEKRIQILERGRGPR